MYKILTKFIGKFHARVRKTSAYPREFGERQPPTRRAAAAADAQAAPRGRFPIFRISQNVTILRRLSNLVPAVGPQVGGQTKLQVGCVGK